MIIEKSVRRNWITKRRGFKYRRKITPSSRLVPNYHYDAIDGEPMYKIYLYKYQDRLEEHRKFILGQENN